MVMQFYKEYRFKDSEIGKVPEDWEVVRLEDVLKFKNGERPELSENGNFPVYGANGIMGHSQKYLVDNDFTIIIGRVGASGEVHLGTGKIWVSDNAIYSENYDKNKINLLFLYYFLKSKRLSRFATKTTHPIITQSFLKSYNISLPPLQEQQKIAEILSTVDQAIQKTDKIIAKTERLKKGLMQELLTGRVRVKVENGQVRFYRENNLRFVEELGVEIPEDWEVVKLKDVIKEFISGGTPSTKNPEYWDGDTPWITSAYISGYYISSGEKYISRKGLENSSTNIVPKNNIIVATRVGLGKAAINLIDVAINQDLTGLIVDRNVIELEFLVRYLTSNLIVPRIISSARGTTIKGITRKFLEHLPVIKPPLPEQKAIAEILSTVDKKLEIEKKEKERLERIKKGLMDVLLTGKVRVRV